jgi:hypothetical protein
MAGVPRFSKVSLWGDCYREGAGDQMRRDVQVWLSA